MKKVFALTLMLAAILIGETRIATAAENQETTTATVTNGNYRLEANSYHRHQIFLTQGTPGSWSAALATPTWTFTSMTNSTTWSPVPRATATRFVGLTVYRSGYFNVKVVNRGSVYNDYTFLVR